MTDARIRQLSRERAARIGRREFDEMVDGFYASDAELLPSGESSVEGIEEIRDFWTSTPARGLVSLTLETRSVHVSGELAYEIGAFSRTLRPRHGAAIQERGKYLVVYEKRHDDAWRAVAEIFNSDSRR